jgi:glycosyltransferase involved in cell wall biosynthesis
MRKKWRLAYLVSHPIQYQAPLLRLIGAEPDIDLTVYFCSDFSLRAYRDREFGQAIAWDVPLTEGYRHEFLPSPGGSNRVGFLRPMVHGLARRLKEQKFDALWVHGWGHWSHIHAIFKAHRLGIRVLLRGEAGSHLPPGPPLKRAVRKILLHHLFSRIDAFLTIGTRNREFCEANGVDAGRIFPMPYAVDNEFFQKEARKAAAGREVLRASLGLEQDRPVVLYASKLTERKRPIDLVEAYARLSTDGKTEPQPYLLFVGDGEQRSSLEARARTLGWRSILFLGFKNQTELPKFYDLCDVFVLPSFNESWGLVVNEVMNAGKAVIVSDQVGAGADLIRAGSNGVVFAAGNVDELAKALAFVIQEDRYVEMGKHSLEAINRWGFREDIAGLRRALETVVGTA